MGLVRGEDVILSAYSTVEGGSDYVPFGCARSVTFDMSTDFIETSVTESGAFKTFLPSGKQYSGNIEGLVFLGNPATNETRATTSWDSSTYTGEFPTLGVSVLVLVTDPTLGSVALSDFSSLSFSTITEFLEYIVSQINLVAGYSAALVGTTITVTARPGLGATINGNAIDITYDFGAGPITLPPVTFSGGVSAFYPSKITMGLIYNYIITGERVQLKYYETDDDNQYLQKLCYVYIESVNETSSFDNMVTFTASFKGDGAPIITYGEI
jgi:hypothetical protein